MTFPGQRSIRSPFLVVALALGTLILGGAPQAHAETTIAIFDVQAVYGSNAYKAAQGQHQAFRKQLKEEVEREHKVAVEEKKKLTAQRKLLDDEAFKEKVREFQKRDETFNRKVNSHLRNIELSHNQGIRTIMGKAREISLAVAKEKGIDLVISKAATIAVMKEDLEITKDVIDRLNKELPTIKLQDPTTIQVGGDKAGDEAKK